MSEINYSGLYALSSLQENIPAGTVFDSSNATEGIRGQAKNYLRRQLHYSPEEFTDHISQSMETLMLRPYAFESDINTMLFLSLPQQRQLLDTAQTNPSEHLLKKFIIENQGLLKIHSPRAFQFDRLAFRIQCGLIIDYLTMHDALQLWAKIHAFLEDLYRSWEDYAAGYYLGQGLFLSYNGDDLALRLNQTNSEITRLSLQRQSPWNTNIWSLNDYRN